MEKILYTHSQMDRTRKNLGNMSKEEAASMAKVLGGEVGGIRDDDLPAKPAPRRSEMKIVRRSPAEKAAAKAAAPSKSSPVRPTSSPASIAMPAPSKRSMRLFFKLYYGERHKMIGFSTYFFGVLFGRGAEKLSHSFLHKILDSDIRAAIQLSADAKILLQMLSKESAGGLAKIGAPSIRFLNAASSWNFAEANKLLANLQKKGDEATVPSAIPFVREIYKNLISVIFVGEPLFAEICERLELEIAKNESVPQSLAGSAISDLKSHWPRVQKNVICGLYPILMRATSKNCQPINSFFSENIAKILEFLGVPRYALVLGGSKKENPQKTARKAEVPVEKSDFEGEGDSDESAENSENSDNQEDDAGGEKSRKEIELEEKIAARKAASDEFLRRQLEFADTMFPDAGWFDLENCPDFFAYFQPLFDFPDGFVEIAPDNPMQFVAVLLRIIDDLTAAASRIQFDGEVLPSEDGFDLNEALQNGYLYMNDNLQRDFVPMLGDYVNNLYSSPSFVNSPNAQRALAKIFWYQKIWFLPYYNFELSDMENEVPRKKRLPLYRQAASLSRILAWVSSNIDSALEISGGKFEGEVGGIKNPWTPYEFSLPNPCSRRLNAVLGGKNSPKKNNANLVKAISAFAYILDWFLNDSESPAYLRKGMFPFRRDSNNAPDFSANLRGDVNEIFIANLRKKIALEKGEKK